MSTIENSYSKKKWWMFLVVLLTILPQYVYISFGMNIVNLLAIIFLLFYLFFVRVIKIEYLELPFFWLYLIMNMIQCAASVGVMKFFSYAILFLVIPFLLIGLISTEERFFNLIDTFIFSGFLLGLFGIVEAITSVNIFQLLANGNVPFFHEVRYGIIRIMTTFGQPISYGIYQNFVIALINYRLPNIKNRKKKKLYVVLTLSVINVLLTGSRIPIAMMIIVQLILIWKKNPKRFPLYLLVTVFLFSVFFFFMWFIGIRIPVIDGFIESLYSLLARNSDIASKSQVVGDRLSLWNWVSKSMGDKWLFGHGVDAEFSYKVYEWQIKTSIENNYLYTLYNTGIVGLIMLLISYVSIIIYSWYNYKKYGVNDNEVISFNYVFMVLMIAYYVACLGVQETDISRSYVLLVVCLIAYNRLNKKKQQKTV